MCVCGKWGDEYACHEYRQLNRLLRSILNIGPNALRLKCVHVTLFNPPSRASVESEDSCGERQNYGRRERERDIE